MFLYFTQEEVMTMLDCGKDKATKLFRELEGIGLMERKKQGQGHPARIYVKTSSWSRNTLRRFRLRKTSRQDRLTVPQSRLLKNRSLHP